MVARLLLGVAVSNAMSVPNEETMDRESVNVITSNGLDILPRAGGQETATPKRWRFYGILEIPVTPLTMAQVV